MTQQINQIHTVCKNCVFSSYDDITQTGCSLNYIDKYKNQNVEIIEAYDNEKEFYIINDKKCIGYRENKWFKQFDLEHASLDEKINKYHETNVLDYVIIINLKSFTIDQLEKTLKQISSVKIQPQKLIMIRYRDEELSFSYNKIEQLMKQHNTHYVWRIQTMLDDTISYEDILHNITTINPKYRFIMSITSYNEDIIKIINHTNKVVHEDLDQFMVISNQNQSCLVYSGAVYRFGIIHGNDIFKNMDHYQII